MRHTPLLLLVLFVFTAFGCGGDKYDAFMEHAFDVSEDCINILESIDDVESAKEAGKKMAELVKDIEALAKQRKELEKPSEEKETELKEKYEPNIEKLQEKFRSALLRLQQLEPDVQSAFEMSLEKHMPESGGTPPAWPWPLSGSW